MPGLTTTGFATLTAAELLADIEASQKAALGADLDVSPEQPLGQLNAIVVTKLRELWELEEAVYNARVPSGASGVSLDSVVEITTTTRRAATFGTATLTVTLDALTTLPLGSVAAVTGQPTNRWATATAVSNGTATAADFSVEATAVATGRVTANSSTITTIATPVVGWLGVTNAADATPGAPLETDPQLRRRRAQTIRAGGSSAVEAVRAALEKVTGVTQVRVFDNVTDFIDADGRPPHSLDALVVGGADQSIANALWSAKSAGIQTWGTLPLTVVDAGGVSRAVEFSRPVSVSVWIDVTVERDPAVYPTAAALQAVVGPALAEVGDLLLVGETVRVATLISTIVRLPGVIDVLSIRVGESAVPIGTVNLAVGRRGLADIDTARVTVVVA